ncbi:hypothetical protein ACH5RR_033730 [Cinchona calisaya]|uniref:Transposase n=1 Tax=Cinchona calisaya TaxID=153742 RepID=A0ABD2YCK6_9GENT
MNKIPKTTRGPTNMLGIWARNSNLLRLPISCNKKGQPVGENKKVLVGFLGTLSINGKYDLVNVIDWHGMPKTQTDEIVDLVKERFDISAGMESWILSSIGKKWRNWKCRIKAEHYDSNWSFDMQIRNRSARYLEDQWRGIVTHWNLDDTKKEELSRPPSRVELFEAYYTDSNSNPRNETVGGELVKMKDFQIKLPHGSLDPVGLNDSFSKARGKDRPGD